MELLRAPCSGSWHQCSHSCRCRGPTQSKPSTLSRGEPVHAGSNGLSHANEPKRVEPTGQDGREAPQWQGQAFASYMQSENDDFCNKWDEALQAEERRQSKASKGERPVVSIDNPVWQAIRKEAQEDAGSEPILSSFLYASILSHTTFEQALAFVLANRLSDATMLATELLEVFRQALKEDSSITQAALLDVVAFAERDPACLSYSSALLYYKGYHAVQVHRIAHHLWHTRQQLMARALQSRVSEVFSIDIHPAARLGSGLLLDHGSGVVIGETAAVGNNVSIMQGVTLGGTGKVAGDRHPKIRDNVLIGASATILGNIVVNRGAQVAAGSLVLKEVAPRTMVAGSPAQVVGKVTGNPALKMEHWLRTGLRSADEKCEAGGEQFDRLIHGAAEQQSDGKPLAQLTFERQQQRPQGPIKSTANEAEASNMWPIKPDEDYTI